MGVFAKIVSSGISTGDIEMVLPKSDEPRGITLSKEYYSRLDNSCKFGFYPRCEVSQVFSESDIENLRKEYCPKCYKLKWINNKLIPIYKYNDIPAIKILSNNLQEVAFPLDYAEYNELNWVYFTEPCSRAYEIIAQYSSRIFKITAKINEAIENINKNNPVYKESLIYSILIKDIYDYTDEMLSPIDITVDKYLELRIKVLIKHPELKY